MRPIGGKFGLTDPARRMNNHKSLDTTRGFRSLARQAF